MNNMGFFNPFGSSGSGGGGGGSTANYSVKTITDSSGQVSYKLTKNGTAVGDVISFNGSNMLVNYGGELVVLNNAIAGIEEALDKTYNFTTFTELEIDTHNKTLEQITDELLTKNLPQNTIVTGQIYTTALPFSGNGEVEVLVNKPALWWTCKSLTIAPYSWTALTADQSWGGVIYDWTPSNYELPAASDSTLGGVKVGSGLAIDQDGVLSATGGGGSQEYIAGDGISIVTGGQIVTDLSSANWGNYADMYDGQRSSSSDSRSFKLRYLHIEPGTQFKIKLTPADPNDTIYWYLYGYENDTVTTGGLHFGPSSDPNNWDTDCDYEYTMPAGKSSLDITVRINNTQYGYGDEVTLSKFDEMQYITGAGPMTKTINVTPATTQAIGGVKIGNNVQIAPDGTISVITTKGDTGTGIASIAKTSSSGLNDIYTITYTDSTTSTFTVTNGATITGGSIGQTDHLILTMSDGRTIDAGALPTDNEVEVTTTSSQPADPNVELWVDLSTQQTLDIPEINDSSTSSIQDTWSCKKIYDEQQRQDVLEAEDRAALTEVIDGGAAGTKNLLDCNLQSIKTVTQNSAYGFSWNGNVCTSTRGASFTINADNSITVAATNTQNDIWFRLTDFMYSAGSYIISGCPTNGSGSSYYLESDALNYRDIGNGVSFTINSTTTDSIYIVVKSGQTFEKTFYPMLCRKALYDVDPSYVPYTPALTNITLTPALIKQVDEGAKNRFDPASAWDSRTAYGVTITRNGDTYSIASGTTQSGDNNFINMGYQANTNLIPAGDWVLSFNTPQQNVRLQVCWNGELKANASFGNNLFFTVPENTTDSWFRILLKGSTNMAGTSFKIMLCPRVFWEISQKFVPYCPTNWDLYESKVDNGLPNISGSILDYADTLLAGVHIVRQGYATGTGKPISDCGFSYMIFVMSDVTAQITALETVSQRGTVRPDIFTAIKVGGSWSSWYKFEGTAVT